MNIAAALLALVISSNVAAPKREPAPKPVKAWTCDVGHDSLVGGSYKRCEWK